MPPGQVRRLPGMVIGVQARLHSLRICTTRRISRRSSILWVPSPGGTSSRDPSTKSCAHGRLRMMRGGHLQVHLPAAQAPPAPVVRAHHRVQQDRVAPVALRLQAAAPPVKALLAVQARVPPPAAQAVLLQEHHLPRYGSIDPLLIPAVL